MMRHLRMLGLVSIAMLALLAAPAVAGAQTSLDDQYGPVPGLGTNPNANAGNEGNEGTVAVTQGNGGNLPFTGGSVPLLLLIGLSLLIAGLLGTAATRKRRSSGSL